MNLLNYMGHTPLVKLENPYGNNCGNVFVKLEEFNPGGSIKSRVGLNMLLEAENNGRLKKGKTLIEPTGGNTGIGLAIAASLRGYKLKLVIPDNFSKEKIMTLRDYGAEVILSNHELGNDSHIIKAREIISANPEKYICLDQFNNLANPMAHYMGTGTEIVQEMKYNVDCFVAAIGSGGTIMGVGKKLKEVNHATKIIGVQPTGCDVLNGKFIPHKIQAIAVGVKSGFLDTTIIDNMQSISYNDVQKVRNYLAKTQGIFVGLSSGANIGIAYRLASRMKKNKNIVTVAPDSGRSYITYA